MSLSASENINLASSQRAIALPEGGVVRGVLQEVVPWSLGLVLAAIGGQLVVLPAELKLPAAGSEIEVLRLEGYSVRRMA